MEHRKIILNLDEQLKSDPANHLIRPLKYDLIQLFNIQSNNEAVAHKLVSRGIIAQYEKANVLDPDIPNGVSSWAAKFFDLISTRSSVSIISSLEIICNLPDIRHYSNQAISLLSTIDGVEVIREELQGRSNSDQSDTPQLSRKILIPFLKIPGTDLYSGVGYRIGIKRFPYGWMSWTEDRQSGSPFVHIDANPERQSLYEDGGSWQDRAIWIFTPSCEGSSFSSFSSSSPFWILRNCSNPNRVWAVGSQPVDHYGKHVVLSMDTTNKDECLLKPVPLLGKEKANANDDNDEASFGYYQLQTKSLPKGVVTWAFTRSDDQHSFYIQLDPCHLPERAVMYEGEWKVDTIFRFEAVGTFLHF